MDEPREEKSTKKRPILDYLLGAVSCLLILLPAAAAWLYVRAFGLSVVFSDAWSMGRIFDKWSSGVLQMSDFFRQHNEHRMFFPKGVEFLLAQITRYNNVAEMYLIQVCFLATLVVLFLAYTDGNRSWIALLSFVPISLLVFSLRQHENMLFGFQINFAFAQTFAVLALFLLSVVGRKGFGRVAFVAALISATVASYSVAQGLLVWPVGLLMLLVGTEGRTLKRFPLVIWGLVGLGEWVGYFVGWRSGDDRSLLYAISHPAAGMEYLMTLLGSSIFLQDYAFWGGVVLAILVLVGLFLTIKRRRLGEYSFWVALLLYSSLILASITLGRAELGVEQALAPRYTTFSLIAVIGVYGVLAKTVLERRSIVPVASFAALSGLILLGAAFSYPKGIEAGIETKLTREKAAFVLYTYESQPNKALVDTLNPRAKTVRSRAPVFQRLGYNVFAEGQKPYLPPPLSTLSPVASPTRLDFTVTGPKTSQQDDGTVVVPEGTDFVKVRGWAVDEDNESAAGGVYVEVDGERFPAFYGLETMDSAEVPYEYSGFERYITLSDIEIGTHEITVVALTADRKGYYQPDKRVILEVR